MEKGKLKLESLSKEFEKFQTTSMESNRPIMDIFQDMFEGKATRNEREKFLRFVSQNEGLKSALSSVIAKNPTLALNFGKFIDKRASNVAKSIESEALTQNMFKGMDSNYAKELKNRYGKVEFDIVKTLNDVDFSEIGNKIDNILSRLEESIPHIVNANQTITAMRKKLEARSEVGLNASDLLDIRKYYNDILRSKDFKNASYKHLQAINKEIDLAIEAGLEDIASKSGIKTDRLLRNYRDINKEYADYARFKDSDFYKDTIKNKTREKDLSDESFNKAILKQAQREEGFNNKVFNRIANNTDKNLQAQAIKELIQRNIANGNGQFKAVKWQELIDDLAKIEHSITDEGLRGLVANLKSAKGLYHADNEFLQAVQRSIGSKPANVLISAASGFFNRTLLLFYNFLHKIMARYAGALSENLAHASLEHQLNLALRYARDTKDFINVSIDSISKNIPLDDREANRVLKELEYWKNQFNKDEISSFYNIKEAQQTEQQIQAHKEVLQEKKEVLDRQIESINAEVQEITQSILKDSNETAKAMPSKRLYTSIEEMEEIERKIENGEIEVEVRQKDLEKLLNSYTMDLKALLAKKDEIEKELEHYKGLSDIDLMEQKSYYVSSSKRALSAIKRDIENTKESINELKAEIQNYGHELIKSDSTNSKTISKALASLNTSDSVSNSKALISASKVYAKSLVPYNKPSMTTNLLTYNTKALPNPNTTNKALVSTNLLNDTKALTYNPSTANNLIKFNQDLERLHELEKYVYKLQTLENHFKDFMSMPFSVIVDSKGNAMPLTIEALKNFIFQNLYKEWLNTRKALNMPILELDFKPLMNKVKALQYKASSETKAHLRIINDKTNSFLDSLQELKAQAKEIKLLPYNKPKENGAINENINNEAINKVNGVGSVVDNLTKSNIVNRLANIKTEPTPKQLTQPQIESMLQRFNNIDNLMQHLNTRPDSNARMGLFHLLDSTMQNPHIQYIKDSKDKYLKKFIDLHSNKDPFFYLLVTKENNNQFVTHLKTRDMDYLANEIKNADNIVKGADIIGALRQQAGAIQRIMETPAPKHSNPTTKPQKTQDLDTKSMDKEVDSKEATQATNKQDLESKELQGVNDELAGAYKRIRDIYEPLIWEREYKDLKDRDKAIEEWKKDCQKIQDGKGLTDVPMDIWRDYDYREAFNEIEKLEAYKKYLEIPLEIREKYAKVPKQSLTSAYYSPFSDDIELKLKNVAQIQAEKLAEQLKMQGKQIFETFIGNEKDTIAQYAKNNRISQAKASERIQELRDNIENTALSNPLAEFGKNYPEYYQNGKEAIIKLLIEARDYEARKASKKLTKEEKAQGAYKGQVAGAFYREELGDIDLVWGEVTGTGKDATGFGLAKIIEKHLKAGDFEAFGKGEQGLINALSEIIEKGEVVSNNGVETIILHKNNMEYRVGISKGWDNTGENKWIITSYKNNKYKGSGETSYHDTFTSKEPLENLASKDSTTKSLNAEAESKTTQTESKQEQDRAKYLRENINLYDFTIKEIEEQKDYGSRLLKSLQREIESRQQEIANTSDRGKKSTLNIIQKNAKRELKELKQDPNKLQDLVAKHLESYKKHLESLKQELATLQTQTTQTESKTTREIIKEAKDKGLSVKETKKLIQKNADSATKPLNTQTESTTSRLNSQAMDYIHKVKQGLEAIINTPLKELADRVYTTNPKFAKREAEYAKQQAKELLDNFSNLNVNTLGQAIQTSKVGYPSQEIIDELKSAIRSGEFKHIFSKQDERMKQTAQNKVSKEVETFTDSKGNTHEIPKEIADKWKETFNLKSLDESYTPSFSQEVKQALEPILQGEEIALSAGSLVKLIGRDRLEFLPYIKETLENSNAVVRQVDGALIFAKDYRDDNLGKFFASVARDENGEWTIRSNAPKSLNGLQNKIKEGGEVLYSDLPELPIIAKPELTAKALNGEANQADSITKEPTLGNKKLDNIRQEWQKIENERYELETTWWEDRTDKVKQEAKARENAISPTDPAREQKLRELADIAIKEIDEILAEQNKLRDELENKVARLYSDLKNAMAKIDNRKIPRGIPRYLRQRIQRKQHEVRSEILSMYYDLSPTNLLDIEKRQKKHIEFIEKKLERARSEASKEKHSQELAKTQKELEDIRSGEYEREARKRYARKIQRLQAEVKQELNNALKNFSAPSNSHQQTLSGNVKENSTTPLHKWQEDLIAQGKSEHYVKDLEAWHKDSSSLTKNEDGSPKVFYHGSEADKPFEVFLNEKDQTKWGFWFSSDVDTADLYAKARGNQTKKHGYKVFLKAKNVFDFNDEKNLEVLKKIFSKEDYKYMLDTLQEWGQDINVFNMLKDTNFDRYKSKAEVFKNELKKLGYDGIKELDNTIAVFDSNQIKHIDNIGSYVDSRGEFVKATEAEAKEAGQKHSYFNESSPNIMHSNAHLGAGLVSGGVAGVETDENGNIVGFSPEKFALGFLGGASASLAVKKGLEIKARSVAKNYSNIAKDNPMLLSEIVKRDLNHYAKANMANSLTRFLNKHKELDINPQIFAGEKALINEAYKPHAKRLEKAKELESNGASEIEIWENTGWYKDKDNKWKFEISQKGGELTPVFYNGYEKWGVLGQILKDDELFSAYPVLRDMRVLAKSESAYNPISKTIELDYKNDNALAHLYHEIQHAVQDIEDFAMGNGEWGSYYHTASYGEIEARNVERRMLSENTKDMQKHPHETSELNPKIQKQNIKDYEKYTKLESQLEKEKEKLEQMREDYSDFGYSSRFTPEKSEKKMEKIRAVERKIDDLEYEKAKIVNNNPSYWTGGDYKKYPNEATKPLISFFNREEVRRLGHDLKGFLDSSGRVDYKKLVENAEDMPQELDIKGFRKQFDRGQKHAIIQTPIKELEIDIGRAFYHLLKSGKYGNGKENRTKISGGILQTLQNPLWITQDKQGSYYFYKPFRDKQGLINLVSVQVDKDNKLLYKTSYEGSENRLEKMIKEYDLVYFAGGVHPKEPSNNAKNRLN